MPAPRATSFCATIRDTAVVTRHGLAAAGPAVPVLADLLDIVARRKGLTTLCETLDEARRSLALPRLGLRL